MAMANVQWLKSASISYWQIKGGSGYLTKALLGSFLYKCATCFDFYPYLCTLKKR